MSRADTIFKNTFYHKKEKNKNIK